MTATKMGFLFDDVRFMLWRSSEVGKAGHDDASCLNLFLGRKNVPESEGFIASAGH